MIYEYHGMGYRRGIGMTIDATGPSTDYIRMIQLDPPIVAKKRKERENMWDYFCIKDSTFAFLSSFECRIRDFFPPGSLHLARANVCPTHPPFIACMRIRRFSSLHHIHLNDIESRLENSDCRCRILSGLLCLFSFLGLGAHLWRVSNLGLEPCPFLFAYLFYSSLLSRFVLFIYFVFIVVRNCYLCIECCFVKISSYLFNYIS